MYSSIMYTYNIFEAILFINYKFLKWITFRNSVKFRNLKYCQIIIYTSVFSLLLIYVCNNHVLICVLNHLGQKKN